MSAEKQPQTPLIGEIEFAVPGLDPGLVGEGGQVLRESNLADPKIQKIIENTLKEPRYQGFVSGILMGERAAFAIFKKHRVLTLVVIPVGTAAATVVAYEFGLRHGKDVRKVIDFLKPKEK